MPHLVASCKTRPGALPAPRLATETEQQFLCSCYTSDMKLTAVSVTSRDMQASIAFYELLGFRFALDQAGEPHVEPLTAEGAVRLMIDTKELIQGILATEPRPATHATFALEYDSPHAVDQTVDSVREHGHTIVKAPWDAFWGQRYAVVADPDGYLIDLYAALPTP